MSDKKKSNLEELSQVETETKITQPQRVIYIGPNNAKLGLEKFKVYKEGLPYNIKSLAEKLPEILQLIIPVQDLPRAMANLEVASSIRIYYRTVQEKLKEMV